MVKKSRWRKRRFPTLEFPLCLISKSIKTTELKRNYEYAHEKLRRQENLFLSKILYSNCIQSFIAKIEIESLHGSKVESRESSC